MTESNDDHRSRQEIEELLPWHAVGALNRRDAARVEAALARDPALRREFDLAREEADSTAHANEALGTPSTRPLDALLAKIDAEPARRPRFDPGRAIMGFFAELSPRSLAWATAAAALVIVVQATALVTGIARKPDQPAGPELAGAATCSGTCVKVRFVPTATASDITAFLRANGAHIVDGPSSIGLYTLGVDDKPLAEDKVEAIVGRLHNAKVVDFVARTE